MFYSTIYRRTPYLFKRSFVYFNACHERNPLLCEVNIESVMKKFFVSMALASFTIITVSSDVQAHKYDCKCTGYLVDGISGSKCATPSGSNADQNEFCENCGWTYINTGEFSPYSNYCKRIAPNN